MGFCFVPIVKKRPGYCTPKDVPAPHLQNSSGVALRVLHDRALFNPCNSVFLHIVSLWPNGSAKFSRLSPAGCKQAAMAQLHWLSLLSKRSAEEKGRLFVHWANLEAFQLLVRKRLCSSYLVFVSALGMFHSKLVPANTSFIPTLIRFSPKHLHIFHIAK